MVKRSYLILILLTIMLFTSGCFDKAADKKEDPAVKTSVTSQVNKSTNESKASNKTIYKENKTSTAGQTPEQGKPADPAPAAHTVKLIITKDFGQQVLLAKEAAIGDHSTVIDILKAVADVTTQYDGSYIASIQGLKSHNGGLSGTNTDWFYYVNGICADIGAGDYTLKPGDVVWWDYHGWKGTGFVNAAVIGCYPEPFKHGYLSKTAAVTLMSSNDNLDLADKTEQALKAQNITALNRSELNNNLLEKRTNPIILIGTWNELKSLPYINELNNACHKTGISLHFTASSLELLDYGGKPARIINGSAGIIAASGTGLGDKNPLWLVAGTDRVGLEQAVNLLTESPGSIARFYSTAIVNGEIIRLPLP